METRKETIKKRMADIIESSTETKKEILDKQAFIDKLETEYDQLFK